MYKKKTVDGVDFSVEINGCDLIFSGAGCTELLRVYGKLHEGYEYAGIAEPDSEGCRLTFSFSAHPEYIYITRGRMDDKHEVVCDFAITEADTDQEAMEISLFNHPATVACIRHYGHICCFCVSCGRVYAFPSDFFTHPLPGFVQYSYWHDIDFGFGSKGYFLIGISNDNKHFFVTEKVLTEFTQGCKI